MFELYFVDKTLSEYSGKLYDILNEVYNKTGFDEHRIAYLGLYGSQNYKMDSPDSDIDTECFIFPSKDDIIFGYQLYSTCITTSYGTCHIKDIRMAFNELRKSSPNILEVFATNYALINTEYAYIMKQICHHTNYFATLNPYRLMRGLEGLMRRYEKDLENPKYFANYIRMLNMIEGVLNRENYLDLIVPPNHDYLTKLKYSEKIGENTFNTIKALGEARKKQMEDFFENVEPNSREDVLGSINFWESELMIKYIKLTF